MASSFRQPHNMLFCVLSFSEEGAYFFAELPSYETQENKASSSRFPPLQEGSWCFNTPRTPSHLVGNLLQSPASRPDFGNVVNTLTFHALSAFASSRSVIHSEGSYLCSFLSLRDIANWLFFVMSDDRQKKVIFHFRDSRRRSSALFGKVAF